jgi:succinoglycan biosynthesis transport protein ExoP
MSDGLRGLDDAEATPRGAGVDRLRAIWKRRKWLGLIVFLLPCTAAVVTVVALPDLYESTALVLVDRQQVPETFVQPTVTSELEVRLRTMSQEILSRTRLEALITRLGLYPDLNDAPSKEEAVERMRRDIHVELQEADPTRPRSNITAFTLSYRGTDPQTVARVTNTLASFYIEENLKARERQATGTSEFLRVQLQDTKKRLDEQEARMGDLQRRYLGELPQQLQSNLAGLEALNQQLRMNSDTQIRLAQRRDQLAAQLAAARAESGDETDEMRLARLKKELATLRIKYTDRWPDIIRIKDEIATLEQQIAEPKPKVEVKAPVVPTPQVLRAQEALQSVETELKLARADEHRLKQRIQAYQTRLDNAPQREQAYLDATRDYESTKELYRELTKRYEEARLGESMEQRQKGEQFRILDSAVVSATPAAPRRFRLLFAGLALSLVLSGGAVVLAEVLDTSFHSTADLRAYTTVPVLVTIPRIVTEGDARRSRRRVRLVAAGVVLGLIVLAGSAFLLAHGNEQLAQLLSRGGRA